MFPFLRKKKKLPLGKNEKQITHGASPTVSVLESDTWFTKNKTNTHKTLVLTPPLMKCRSPFMESTQCEQL